MATIPLITQLEIELTEVVGLVFNAEGETESALLDQLDSTVEALKAAVAQLVEDNHAALRMLEADGQGDSPVAGFLRAAIARAGRARERTEPLECDAEWMIGLEGAAKQESRHD